MRWLRPPQTLTSGELRITAAQLLTALGDSRGGDLYAAAVTAAVKAPIPFEAPSAGIGMSAYGDEMFRRRQITLDFARTGHPKAIHALRVFLTDDRFDARTREYVYRMLAEGSGSDPCCADACAALLAELPPGGSEDERYGRDRAVEHIVAMTDSGSADRLAVIAAATTLAPGQRLRAALQLTKRGDHRAADPLIGLLAESMSISERLSAAWGLVKVGDMRAVPALTALTRLDATQWAWPWRRQSAAVAKSGNPGGIQVLTALATALPGDYRLCVLLGLCEIGNRQALDIAAEIGPDYPAKSRFLLHALADALARHGDPRFAGLLEMWASSARTSDPDEAAEHEWATTIMAEPARILGTGLYATMAASKQLPLSVRSRALWDMIEADHPQFMPYLLEMLPELMSDTTGQVTNWIRTRAIDLLADRGRPEAVPYLVAQIRDPNSPESDRDDAVVALTKIDGQAAADSLGLIAPELPYGHWGDSYYTKYLVGKRLVELRHEKAVEILTGWVDADRAHRYVIDDWMLNLLLALRAPRAADLIDEEVRNQISYTYSFTIPKGWSEAIETLACRGQPGADVLARWTQDDSFHIDDRVEALLTLRTLGDERATALRDDLLASGSLNFFTHRRVKAAFRD